jgi:hypothetical protein
MARNDAGLGSCVVVVGDPSSELVQTTRQWAREGEIDVVLCEDVYAAVVRIVQAGGRRVLALGTMRELTRENGAFFRIAAAHAIPCCCWLDRTGPVGRKDVHAALEAGVRLVDAVADVRRILKEWLGTPPPEGTPRPARQAAPSQRGRGAAADTSYEEFRATEAELNALLE